MSPSINLLDIGQFASIHQDKSPCNANRSWWLTRDCYKPIHYQTLDPRNVLEGIALAKLIICNVSGREAIGLFRILLLVFDPGQQDRRAQAFKMNSRSLFRTPNFKEMLLVRILTKYNLQDRSMIRSLVMVQKNHQAVKHDCLIASLSSQSDRGFTVQRGFVCSKTGAGLLTRCRKIPCAWTIPLLSPSRNSYTANLTSQRHNLDTGHIQLRDFAASNLHAARAPKKERPRKSPLRRTAGQQALVISTTTQDSVQTISIFTRTEHGSTHTDCFHSKPSFHPAGDKAKMTVRASSGVALQYPLYCASADRSCDLRTFVASLQTMLLSWSPGSCFQHAYQQHKSSRTTYCYSTRSPHAKDLFHQISWRKRITSILVLEHSLCYITPYSGLSSYLFSFSLDACTFTLSPG